MAISDPFGYYPEKIMIKELVMQVGHFRQLFDYLLSTNVSIIKVVMDEELHH